jgi:hypothetical protein
LPSVRPSVHQARTSGGDDEEHASTRPRCVALAVFQPYDDDDDDPALSWQPTTSNAATNLRIILGRLVMELVHAVLMDHVPTHSIKSGTRKIISHTARLDSDVRVALALASKGSFPSKSSQATPAEYIATALAAADYAVPKPNRVPACQADRVSFKRAAAAFFVRLDPPQDDTTGTAPYVQEQLVPDSIENTAAAGGLAAAHAATVAALQQSPAGFATYKPDDHGCYMPVYNTVVSRVDPTTGSASAYMVFATEVKPKQLQRTYCFTDPRGDRWVLHAAIIHSGGEGAYSHYTAVAADTVEAIATDGTRTAAQATYAHYDGSTAPETGITFADLAAAAASPRTPQQRQTRCSARVSQQLPPPAWAQGTWKVALYVREHYAAPVAITSPIKWTQNNCWLAASTVLLAAMQPRLFYHWRHRAMSKLDTVNVWRPAKTLAGRQVYLVEKHTLLSRNTATPTQLDAWATQNQRTHQTLQDNPFPITRPPITPNPITAQKLARIICNK